MRSSPIFSDTRLSLSFFLTRPAKKPRTECCCQSVGFMIAAMVVPFGCRSIASTASCLDEGRASAFADPGFAATALEFAFAVDLPDPVALTEPFAERGDLCAVFLALGFDLPVAIWISLALATASSAATDMSPVVERGER